MTLGKYGSPNESEEDQRSPGKVKLLYSENDSICNAVLSVYQKLLDKNNHDVEYLSRSKSNPSNKGYWEDAYPDAFKNAGFVIPDKLIDYSHKSDERTSYYKLKLDPRLDDQAVLIQDYEFGGHGDYSSEVYISKPKEDISTVCSLDYFASFASDAYENDKTCIGNGKKHNALSFATNFNGFSEDSAPHAERVIEGLYEFSKIKKLKISGSGHKQSIGFPLVQRMYLFKGNPFFTARYRDANSVVYQIKNSSQIEDVCYLTSN